MDRTFRPTMVVARLAKTECNSCKLVELLKHQACSEGCHGDTRSEQLLAAEKIKREIESGLAETLSNKFTHSHDYLHNEIEVLKQQVLSYGEKANLMTTQYRKPETSTVSQRLVALESRLDTVEDSLNDYAVYLIEAKENASLIC